MGLDLEDFRIRLLYIIKLVTRLIFISVSHLKSHQRRSLPVVVCGPCEQGSRWPSTSRVILCQ